MLHQKAVKQILRYIKGTIEFGLDTQVEVMAKLLGFVIVVWPVILMTEEALVGWCFMSIKV